MAPSIVPLSEVSPDTLREFLGRVGVTRDVVDWRYLDPGFNRGRNRGFAWLRRNRMEGMIGLIPFRIGGGGPTREVNWSSDWTLADPTSNPGMGVLLLRRAIEASGELFALGGNENTRRLLPRMASRTIPDAGIAMHLPLRSGAILRHGLGQRILGRLPLPRALYLIPLRRAADPGPSADIKTVTGVAPQIGPLLEAGPADGWYPRYDLTYVDWQIGRSPTIRCWTSYHPSVGEPRAAAVYWRPASSNDFWRLAVWSRPGSFDHLSAVVRAAVAEIYRQGALAVSAIVSRLDLEIQTALKSAGFIVLGRRRPLYVCAGQSGAPINELHGLSYLDTDLAYRF